MNINLKVRGHNLRIPIVRIGKRLWQDLPAILEDVVAVTVETSPGGSQITPQELEDLAFATAQRVAPILLEEIRAANGMA